MLDYSNASLSPLEKTHKIPLSLFFRQWAMLMLWVTTSLCVHERERERESVCESVCVRVRACVCEMHYLQIVLMFKFVFLF